MYLCQFKGHASSFCNGCIVKDVQVLGWILLRGLPFWGEVQQSLILIGRDKDLISVTEKYLMNGQRVRRNTCWRKQNNFDKLSLTRVIHMFQQRTVNSIWANEKTIMKMEMIKFI